MFFKVRLRKLAPDVGLIYCLSEFRGSLNIVQLHEQNVKRLDVRIFLFVNVMRLFEEPVLNCLLGDLDLILVQTLNIIHNLRLLGPHSCHQQQILQVFICAELLIVQDDLLQKREQLKRHVGG